jgi:hypothetical protein
VPAAGGVLVRCPECLLQTIEPVSPAYSTFAWAAEVAYERRRRAAWTQKRAGQPLEATPP